MPDVYSHYRSADFNLVEHLGLENNLEWATKQLGELLGKNRSCQFAVVWFPQNYFYKTVWLKYLSFLYLLTVGLSVCRLLEDSTPTHMFYDRLDPGLYTPWHYMWLVSFPKLLLLCITLIVFKMWSKCLYLKCTSFVALDAKYVTSAN